MSTVPMPRDEDNHRGLRLVAAMFHNDTATAEAILNEATTEDATGPLVYSLAIALANTLNELHGHPRAQQLLDWWTLQQIAGQQPPSS